METAILEALAAVPVWNWGLQLVGLVASYVGAELNARMRVSCFYLWTLSAVALGMLHAASGLWLLLLLDVLFLRVNALGVVRWSRQYPEQAPSWLRGYLARNARPSGA